MNIKIISTFLPLAVAGSALGCGGSSSGPGGGTVVTITAVGGGTRFDSRDDFLAGGEMQISGEPLAETMKRDLAGYSRDHIPPDIYFDPAPDGPGPWIDLAGFSTGIESYEYSKQPMNFVAFESGAGTSLVYGPLVSSSSGAGATTALAARLEHLAQESHALGRFVFPHGTFPQANASGDVNPHGAGDPADNLLGWPGIWPTVHVFASFDPSIDPQSSVGLQCSISSDDNPGSSEVVIVNDWECNATTLHLRDRATQIDPTITPGADGFAGWKYGLWALNYLQIMHDSNEAAVASVAPSDLLLVGTAGNVVVGFDDAGAPTAEGTFLGSSDIEGFQAALLLEEADNRAEDWLTALTTTGGVTLGGFASTMDADAYAYDSPLRWFPGSIAVSESDDGSGFPRPAYAIDSADSHLLDLVGMGLAYSEFYALTDLANADVGGAAPARVYFDGDPFPADDQVADGEATLHDRALGMLRVTMIDLDRLHTDPASGLLVDDVSLTGGVPSRGTTVSTASVAYSILGLRTVLRSLGSQLELYSNNTPDTAITGNPLDALPIHHPADASLTFSGRLEQILANEARLLYDRLTDEDGRAFDGWDVSADGPTSTDDGLDAHTAAIRGLLAAYLATGDVRFRDRAMAVYARMDRVFYDPAARIYLATPVPADAVEYTPVRFALLQSALRDVYEIVAARPGGEWLELTLESRIARLNKLVLNGWDDRDGDRRVKWPDECLQVDANGLPRGGLQMAERSLTGELGHIETEPGDPPIPTSDRDSDCVPEIDDAHLPPTLAPSITFTLERD